MSIEEIIEFLEGLGGVLTLRPGPGDGSPELAWGDVFFYYAPDGVVPQHIQPFATIVTKNYPGDEESRLDRPDTFRVNFFAGRSAFVSRIGHEPREPATQDASAPDTLLVHPVYGRQGWLAVVNPGQATETAVRELLTAAHDLARTRCERRADRGRPGRPAPLT